jgi:2-iminobutanoate/2-iminopropanoate deaminase
MRHTVRDQAIFTGAAPLPKGPYSQGVVVGNLLLTSGFGPHDPETGKIAPSIEEQTRQTLLNITAVLNARGLTLDDVVKVNAYLQDVGRDFTAFNATYQSLFEEPYPARTTVGSNLLDILVELDVVARLPQSKLPWFRRKSRPAILPSIKVDRTSINRKRAV